MRVWAKHAQFGLVCKNPELIENGAQVLGLEVWKDQDKLLWRQGTAVPEIPNIITQQTIFSLCGKLVGHLPVCRWLHVAMVVIKCRASMVTQGCDVEVTDTLLTHMVKKTPTRV